MFKRVVVPRSSVILHLERSRFAVQPRRTQLAALRGVRFYSETKENLKDDEANGEIKSDNTSEPGESGTTEGEKSELDVLKQKFEQKDKELAKYKDLYARSVADFRNLQETTKRETQNARDFALQKFIKDLIESVDNFDRALTVVPEDKRTDRENFKELADLYDGFRMMQTVFEKTLAKHGLEKVNPIGEKFDPNVHEATFEVPQPDKEPGTIFHVQQPGFSLNKRVLRAAKVGVVKGQD
jgi:molecular chaperone GrpE